MSHNLSNLETKGFVVLKDFFSSDDIELLLSMYRQEKESLTKNTLGNPRYKIVNLISPDAINDKISMFLREVNEKTDLVVDSVQKQVSFYDTELINWKWHQDLEPYLLFQDSYNSVNFWFPLVKPDPDRSGLSLVPMDVLIAHDPTAQQTVLRKGGKGLWVSDDRRTQIKDHFHGSQFSLDVDIESIMETPDVSPGDVIAFRYDVIHKTQPNSNSDRISASIRTYNSAGVISLSHLLSPGGPEKTDAVNRMRAFGEIKKIFESKQSDTLRLADISDLLNKKAR